MPIGAIIGAVGGLVGGAMQSSAASDAAAATAGATRYAADLQHQQFEQIQNNMQPFIQGGTSGFEFLQGLYGIGPNGASTPTPYNQPISQQIGPPPSPTDPRFATLGGSSLTAPPNPSDPALRDQFRASPGYDYLIRQMTDATQNSAAGRTGAISGNMLQALQRNAGGIADQDWNNWYGQDVASWSNNNQNWWNIYNGINANYGQQYQDVANNRNTMTSVLGGFGATGQNAAANLGGFGQAAATSIGNAAISGANAQGAARIAGANAFSGAIPQIGNSISSMLNPNGGSGNGGLNYLLGGNQYGGNNFPGAYASPSDFAGGVNPGSSYAYPYDPAASAAGYGYAGV